MTNIRTCSSRSFDFSTLIIKSSTSLISSIFKSSRSNSLVGEHERLQRSQYLFQYFAVKRIALTDRNPETEVVKGIIHKQHGFTNNHRQLDSWETAYVLNSFELRMKLPSILFQCDFSIDKNVPPFENLKNKQHNSIQVLLDTFHLNG